MRRLPALRRWDSRAIQERFAVAFRSSHVAIGVSRLADGRFVEVNAAFLKLFGYARHEVIGHTSRELRMWAVRADRTRMLRQLKRGEDVSGLLVRQRRKNGTTAHVLISASLVDIGGEQHLIGTLTDVSERWEIFRAQQESEARLRVALAATGLLAFQHDRQLRYTWIVNPTLGFDAGVVLGRTDAELLGNEEAALLTRIKRRVLRSGRSERNEVWVRYGDQAACYDLVVEPDRDVHGRIVGITCAAADITARKAAEQEIAQIHRRQQALAAHLQDSLEAERVAVARDVHDDIGAMLTGMRLRLERIAEGGSCTDQSCQADVHTVAAMAERALAATRELCARLRPPALDDLGLAETCRWYLRDWAATTGLRVEGRFGRLAPEPDAGVSTDTFRILQELLTNIARHARATLVRVALTSSRYGLRLRVTDDGCGFDPSAGADGFGLAGVRERASRHGGAVSIDSGSAGTTVVVMLGGRVR